MQYKLAKEIIKQIRKDAKSAIEIGYLLIAKKNKDTIYLTYLSQRVGGQDNEIHIEDVSPTLALLFRANLKDEFYIGGWAHTHPSKNGFKEFSPKDINTQEEIQQAEIQQKLPQTVALVGSKEGVSLWKVENGKAIIIDYSVFKSRKDVFLEDIVGKEGFKRYVETAKTIKRSWG